MYGHGDPVILGWLLACALAADVPCFADGERVPVSDPRLRDPACSIPVGVTITASVVELRPGVKLDVFPPCAASTEATRLWVDGAVGEARRYFTLRGIAAADILVEMHPCVAAPHTDARILELRDPPESLNPGSAAPAPVQP